MEPLHAFLGGMGLLMVLLIIGAVIDIIGQVRLTRMRVEIDILLDRRRHGYQPRADVTPEGRVPPQGGSGVCR